MWKTATGWILVITVIALSAYDIAAMVEGGVESTISRVVLRTAKAYPIFGVALGVLIGHLLVPQTIKPDVK